MPEFFGSAIFFLFKNTVEIRDIVKPAFISDFIDAVRGFNQHPRSVSQADLVQCINKCLTCSLFKETA